jgi:AmmeMemoRadiSam system protein B
MKTKPNIRPPAVAGRFYPGDPDGLSAFVKRALEGGAPTGTRVRAVIGPHAGYVFSGGLCGRVYGSVEPDPARIWLLGPSHHVALRDWTGCSHDRMATPSGETRVDRGALEDLFQAGCAVMGDRAHGPEHALETHLPFLWFRWAEVPVVPLLSPFRDDPGAADWLAERWREGDLLAVSSDLSHFHPVREAERLDAGTRAAVEEGRPGAIGPEEACGWVSVRTALRLAERMEWRAHTVGLATSAAVTGDGASVVGYGGWIFTEEP